MNASAGADVRSAEVTSIADGGARAHMDADDIEIANVGAHVDAADGPSANTSAHVGAGSMKIVSAGAHGGASRKLDAAILRTQARTALTGLGWKPAIARAAVTTAAAGAAPDVTLEQLIYASLRHCPVPNA
ncbi:MAG TPA: hypothetical protein VHN14_31645 [Kofleriaceae bacterium]|nr:hypothetical protein [Kofleriaceae bacterium]